MTPKNRVSLKSYPIATHNNADESKVTVRARIRLRITTSVMFLAERETPLATRAWTLQEQLLASQMVHFTDSEIIWECRTNLRCEYMELDRNDKLPRTPHTGILSYHDSLSSDEYATKFKAGGTSSLLTQIGISLIKPISCLPHLGSRDKRKSMAVQNIWPGSGKKTCHMHCCGPYGTATMSSV